MRLNCLGKFKPSAAANRFDVAGEKKGMGTYQQLVAIIVGHAPSSTIKNHLTANTFIHFLINMQ